MTTVAQHLVHSFGIRRPSRRVRGRILSVQFSPRRPASRRPRLAAAHDRGLYVTRARYRATPVPDEALPIIERPARDTDESVMFVVDELLAGNVTFRPAVVG